MVKVGKGALTTKVIQIIYRFLGIETVFTEAEQQLSLLDNSTLRMAKLDKAADRIHEKYGLRGRLDRAHHGIAVAIRGE